jgi:eukaryotic-like serine/threonine-protein kinase
MQTISSPYNGGTASGPRRTKSPHYAAATTYRLTGSAGRGATGKVAAAPRVGTQRRYQTRELLGRGGMSEVYRGFDAELSRPVAIKRLRPELAVNPVFRARFRREAQAAGRLNHPAIVAVYDTGEEREATGSSIPFIVMELVEGRSLRDALRQEGRVAPSRALELTAEVLDALACSHAAGIIHRDIKPGNVMLSNGRAVKVADFGIARAVSDSSGTATMAGTVIGTAQYLSPEQGRGEAADVRSDLYSAGCLLYELLVGEPPFVGDSMVSIIFQHISEPPTRPSAANSDISADIDAIIMKALAKSPADRYQSAAEMKADVDNVLGGRPPAATTVLPPSMIEASEVGAGKDGSTDRHRVETSAVERPRARRLIASLTAVLFVMGGASAFGIYRSDKPEAAAVTTTEVPAVLGLGPVGVESLLRNADLVPRFEFVHGAGDASVDTAIKQIPAGGEMAAIDNTVTVVINIGPRRETVPTPSLTARDLDFRPWAGQPSVAAGDGQSSAKTRSAGTQRWQSGQSDTSQQTGGSNGSLQSQQSDTSQQTGGSDQQTEGSGGSLQSQQSDTSDQTAESDGSIGNKIKKSGKPKARE